MCVGSEKSDETGNVPLKTPRKPDRPVLWIVAGPNGSGKSSFYNRTDIEGWGGSVWIINPDLLTQQIVEREALPLDQANLAAVQRIQQWLEASIETYQTIGVETVLSSPKYRDLVLKAQSRGFRVKMIYVLLRSAELQIERVRIRVSEGGHDVPADKIVDRRRRSFAELGWFAAHVDDCYLFDNSTGDPALLAARTSRGPLWQFAAFPKDLAHMLAMSKIDIRPAAQ
ncbi:zeta toxin family protein [Sphingomonas oligophenolica]|uniref:Zeta toxin family protein n=1 Tax=Sphingomonas oligophenolica TaxID=301154 RepID=A0ABU9YBJ8_9SPHN